MKKKMTAALLCMVMMAAIIGGCGAKGGQQEAPSNAVVKGNAERSEEQEKIAEEVTAETEEDANEDANEDAEEDVETKETTEESTQPDESEKDGDKEEAVVVKDVQAADKEAKKMYFAFLDGKRKAETSKSFLEDDEYGNYDGLEYGSYTFSELKAVIDSCPVVADSEEFGTQPQYAFVDFGNDGISDMVIRFLGETSGYYNWVGIVHYDGEKLMLTGQYEYGYRSLAVLYTNGYINYSGSFGAGASTHEVSRVDKDGVINKCFTEYCLYGSFAENAMYMIDKNSEGFYEDYSNMGSVLEVRSYKAEGSDKVYISCDDWSKDRMERSREEKMVGELEDSGAERISVEKMDELTSLPDDIYLEPSWQPVLESRNAKAYTEEIVNVSFATDLLLGRPETYIQYVDDDSAYRVNIVVAVSEEVTNFCFYHFDFWGCDDDGTAVYRIKEKDYSLDRLTPDKPLVITTTFPGDTPTIGISYIDADDNLKVFGMGLSGYDGTPYLCKARFPDQYK